MIFKILLGILLIFTDAPIVRADIISYEDAKTSTQSIEQKYGYIEEDDDIPLHGMRDSRAPYTKYYEDWNIGTLITNLIITFVLVAIILFVFKRIYCNNEDLKKKKVFKIVLIISIVMYIGFVGYMGYKAYLVRSNPKAGKSAFVYPMFYSYLGSQKNRSTILSLLDYIIAYKYGSYYDLEPLKVEYVDSEEIKTVAQEVDEIKKLREKVQMVKDTVFDISLDDEVIIIKEVKKWFLLQTFKLEKGEN